MFRKLNNGIAKRILALLLAISIMVPYFTSVVQATGTDPDAGTICGYTAHSHSAECYLDDAVICGNEEHTHTDLCYPAEEPEPETQPENAPVVLADEPGTTDNGDLSGYTKDLVVYNYLHRTNSDGSGLIMSQDSTFNLSGTFAHNITIGGDATQTDSDRIPMQNEIKLNLNNLVVADPANAANPVHPVVTILPVFPSDPTSTATKLTIKGESAFETLILKEDACANIVLNAPLTISSLTLEEGSNLVIETNGNALTLTNTTGTGSLTITGNGDVTGESLACGDLQIDGTDIFMKKIIASGSLQLDGANVYIQGGEVTGMTAVRASNTSINGASHFGIAANATGDVQMEFTQCAFTNVTTVGATQDCQAVVSFDASSTITSASGTTFICDYSITYAGVAVQNDWITHYRVSSTEPHGEGTILTEKKLPEYAASGYSYMGWKTDPESETAITELTNEHSPLTLYLVTEAGDVTITLDLGFVPNSSNNDDYEALLAKYPSTSDTGSRYATVIQKLDTEIALDTLSQFGYAFLGWKVDGTDTLIHTDSYDLTLENLTNADALNVRLVAQWEKESFPLSWTFYGTAVPLDYIQVSLDGGNTWTTPADLVEDYPQYWQWNSAGQTMSTTGTEAGNILFGETLNEYFQRLNSGWQYPILRDARTGDAVLGAEAQAFQTWAMIGNTTHLVSANSTFDCNEQSGFLQYRKPANMTWAQYQADLNGTPISLTSSFGTADYNLDVGNASGWTYYVNGTATKPTNGILVVPNGATVSFACAYTSGLSISDWAFSAENNDYIFVDERYTSGAGSIYYDFTMPASNVKATYSTTATGYVDIAESAITFVKGVDPTGNGISRNGFWYNGYLNGGTTANFSLALRNMTPLTYNAENGYFYIWNSTRNFYVTSDGVATTNQLTLVDTITVNLQAARLVAREAYLNNAVGRRIYGTAVELPRDSSAAGSGSTAATAINGSHRMGDMANIVLANDGATGSTFTLSFIGKGNILGAVFTDRYYYQNKSTLKITGQSQSTTALTLGTAFANSNINVSNITINEYDEANSEYLLHTSAASCSISLNTVNMTAPGRELYVKDSSLSMTTSTADVKTVVAGQSAYVNANCNLRVRENFYIGYATFSIGANAVVVIDGNFLTKYFHWTTNVGVGSSGCYLIVKGNRCELGNSTWTAGTLICNSLVLGRVGGVSGGKVVANQIMNLPAQHWNISYGQTEYVFNNLSQNEAVSKNGDTYPFLTYSQITSDSAAEYNFTGGEVYLLGVNEDRGSYSTTKTALDTPAIAALLDPMLDDDGGYNKTALSSDTARIAVQNNKTTNECVILGNSTYNTDTRSRTFNFGGNVKLYASGNVTLFNDTNVYGNAQIWCGGTFGTKNEMNVTGGAITAKEVGIAHTLTTTLEDTTLRWKKLTVTEGASITADRVGTLSTCVSNTNVTPRGALEIALSALKTDSRLEHDAYVNYMLGTAGFTNPEANKNLNNVHLFANVSGAAAEYSAGPVAFAAPTVGTEAGGWKLDAVTGTPVDGVATDAHFIYGETVQTETAYQSDRIVLFAVKDSYNVLVKTGLTDITAINGNPASATTSIKAGDTVTLTISSAQYAAHKTVVWYVDGTGAVRNPDYKVEGNQVTFTMPYNDVEIFVSPDSFDLDLSKYHVAVEKEGFRTTLEEDPTRTFHYTGSLRIYRSLSQTTEYRVLVEENVDNITDTSRTITLDNIAQTTTVGDIGVKLLDGAKARILIQGSNDLCRVEVTENSEIILEGANSADPSKNKILINSGKGLQVTNGTALGNYNGKAGNMTMKYLTYSLYSEQFSVYGAGSVKNTNTVAYYGCVMNVPNWYNADVLAKNAGQLIVSGCNFEMEPHNSWPAALVNNVDNVLIENSTIVYGPMGSGSSVSKGFTRSINNKLTVKNSQITLSLRPSTTTNLTKDAGPEYGVPVLELSGNTVYTAEDRFIFNTVILNDSSTLKMGANGDGYLLADTVEVNGNATVNAGTILLSGYATNRGNSLTSRDEVINYLSASNPTLKIGSASGLTINGGTVNADAVGGDRNSVINVKGGTLNANKIGTMGKIYGYATYVPKVGEEIIYSVEKMPQLSTVNITGGTVNVGQYLGGMNAQVNVSGGTVNLAANAILGMTDSQADTLKNYYSTNGQDIADHTDKNIRVNVTGGQVLGSDGIINTPYGTTDISGQNTGVNVGTMSALYGNIAIRTTSAPYDNGLENSPKVGVYVHNQLNAQEILITNGAQVYANEAFTNAPLHSDSAKLTINDKAVLYTQLYGTMGQGTFHFIVDENGLIQRTRQHAIAYYMRDDAVDRAVNDVNNPESFVYNGEGGTLITIGEPTRHGYDFLGWYDHPAVAELVEAGEPTDKDPIESFENRYPDDVKLYAAWKPKEVAFQIQIDASKHPEYNLADEFAEMVKRGQATVSGDVLTLNGLISVAYLETMFDADGIDLNVVGLPSYVIKTMQVVVDENQTIKLDPTNATVTSQILAIYQKNCADPDTGDFVVLQSEMLDMRNQKIVLDLNQPNGRPVDAAFADGHNATIENNTIYTYVTIGSTLATADKLLIEGKLNEPSAPGYRFVKWQDKDGNTIDTNYPVDGSHETHFYAKWEPIQYKILLNTDGGDLLASAVQNNTVYGFYDSQINGKLSFVSGQAGTEQLPAAKKAGYRFKGWSVNGETLLENEELNKATFGDALNLGADYALTLTAVYEPVKVTYHLNGGSFTETWLDATKTTVVQGSAGDTWISKAYSTTVGHGIPLAGYTLNPVAANVNTHELHGTVGDFAVIATTSKYYEADATKGTYFTGDYRQALSKKGYTFKGWKDKNDNLVVTLPESEDIELYAQWSANEYTVKLWKGDIGVDAAKPQTQYSWLKGEATPVDGSEVSVKVGEEIGDSALWPNRDDWYALGKEAEDVPNNHRYLLGFTFDRLEPGDPTVDGSDGDKAYDLYANYVTALINHDALMTKREQISGQYSAGSIFHLPMDRDYNGNVVLGTNAVPDYPDGCSFDMYAVYRERSLVFIERYIDTQTGETVQTVRHSAPYNVYCDYPDTYAVSEYKKNIVDKGYTLTRWAVNTPLAPETYVTNNTDYLAKINGWISDAKALGRYDVNIYTVYAAQAKSSLTLTATSDRVTAHSAPVDYVVPNSIVIQRPKYAISGVSGLTIVEDEEALNANRYNPTHDNDVAIFMELLDQEKVTQGELWLNNAGGVLPVDIGAGWTIRLTAYHSRVISQAEEGTFKLEFSFENNQDQSITMDPVTVKFVPTLWQINYNAQLPADDKRVVEPGIFTGSGDVLSRTVMNWIYGTSLLDQPPVVEGYTGNGWRYSAEQVFNYGANAAMNLTSTDPIQLTTSYTANEYTLTNQTTGWISVPETGEVAYHTQVTLTPDGTQNPQFVWLQYDVDGDGDGDDVKYRLDRLVNEQGYGTFFYADYNEENGTYTFLMPAGDVTIFNNDVMDLYLDNGTIDITETTYKQNGNEVFWSGHYRIWQDKDNNTDNHTTANVLNLSGDLDNRKIELGVLNITSADSIALADGTTANLTATGKITAKNILVPGSSTLELSPAENTEVNVSLAPGKTSAAIGGKEGKNDGAGGTITVNNLNLSLTMPAGSKASGIGGGDEDAASGVINVSNCTLTVDEMYNLTESVYSGTWIGGRNSGAVNVTNTQMFCDDESSAAIVDSAATVTLTNCQIGTTTQSPVKGHVIRGGNVMVNSSDIYLNGSTTTQICPANAMYVDQALANGDAASVIYVDATPNTLYYGTLYIYNAATDVMIANTQLLDQANGHITITTEGVTQADTTHAHTGGYRLLNNVKPNVKPDELSNVTVNGLNSGMNITTETECKLNTLTINADATLKPLAELPIKEVNIASGELTVDADGAGLNPAAFGGSGDYTQNGGTLKSAANITVGGNMTLNNVTVTATGKAVGSTGSPDAVTTVAINGTTVINAANVGAIGTQSETFTFVELADTASVNGILVQDHYRLHYNLEDPNFGKNDDGVPLGPDNKPLPTVLRSQTVYAEGQAGEVTYLPAIPDDPKFLPENGTSYFGTWYLQLDKEQKVALNIKDIPTFTTEGQLSADYLEYAGDVATDNTRTLEIYSWMTFVGTGTISYGRILNAMPTVTEPVVVESNGAWTAKFDVEGVGFTGAQYQFKFETAIPAKTKLTVSVRAEKQQPVFYYYIPTEATQTVNATDFIRMGTTDTLSDGLFGVAGTDQKFKHSLQLSADFVDVTAVDNTVTLDVKLNETSALTLDSVDYTVKAPYDAQCTATTSNVTYKLEPNGDSRLYGQIIYLVAQFTDTANNKVSIPYDAKIMLDGTEGTRIGANQVYFDLGAYSDESTLSATKSWSKEGLLNGNYKVKWILTAAKDGTDNIHDRELASADPVEFAINMAEPYLDVQYTGDTCVFTSDATVAFTWTTNAAKVSVQLEKQTTLGIYDVVNTNETTGGNTSVDLPDGEGTYRVRFSLDGFDPTSSVWDDVYFGFIVK